ncbi:unnamed protein product [Rotaria magnacalcarata]|uniref:TIR domain-containing protein n=3 Tax=Rotaria magnacalcarata TaxID=392030 RepID=A0A815DIR9_9BILA|nr:unnamed protein product [Rotaria magnacalcarata]
MKFIFSNSLDSDNCVNECRAYHWTPEGHKILEKDEIIHETSARVDLSPIENNYENALNENKSWDLMISYCRADRELCYRIHDRLKKTNKYKIWIENEGISLNTSFMESIAEAVEKSKIVLVCMSNRYYESQACRAECQYAHTLKRIICPLIVERNYKPSGWLGFVTSGKLYLNFAKLDFDETLDQLIKEIDRILYRDIQSRANVLISNDMNHSEDVAVKPVSVLSATLLPKESKMNENIADDTTATDMTYSQPDSKDTVDSIRTYNSLGIEQRSTKNKTLDRNELSPIENNHGIALNENKSWDLMISYCRADRELCYRIHDRLKKTNKYKIWIENEGISLNTSFMESIAEAVEKSKIVLVCMSNRYYESQACRAECQYAHTLKRIICPLIVERNYKPSGWLGFVTSGKLYLNFAKLDFDETLDQLIKEIDRILYRDIQSRANVLISNDMNHSEDVAVKPVSVLSATLLPKESKMNENIADDTTATDMTYSQPDSKDTVDSIRTYNSLGIEQRSTKNKTLDRNELSPIENNHGIALNENKSWDLMISYCRADRELCYRIHDRLKKTNKYKIWIENEGISLNTSFMESIAEAVEKSKIVLVCMSNRYYESQACRAECQYAHTLKRIICPLIVERNYKPSGWLGFVTSGKLYLNFAKLDFDETLDQLIKEIDRILYRDIQSRANVLISNDMNHSEDVAVKPVSVLSATLLPKESKMNENIADDTTATDMTYSQPDSNDTVDSIRKYNSLGIEQWSTQDVLNFLNDQHLKSLLPLCVAFNGRQLYDLYKTCKKESKNEKMYEKLRLKTAGLSFNEYLQFLQTVEPHIPKQNSGSSLCVIL